MTADAQESGKIKGAVSWSIALYYVTLVQLCFWFELFYQISN